MSFCKSLAVPLDVSTRGKRRNAVKLVVEVLEVIRLAEERYLDRIPVNLQGGDAYAAADYSVDSIIDAIVGLSDAY